MPPNIVTFGEIMLRLSPPGRQRLGQARSIDAIYSVGDRSYSYPLSSQDNPAQISSTPARHAQNESHQLFYSYPL
jgi:hypothetical protein